MRGRRRGSPLQLTIKQASAGRQTSSLGTSLAPRSRAAASSAAPHTPPSPRHGHAPPPRHAVRNTADLVLCLGLYMICSRSLLRGDVNQIEGQVTMSGVRRSAGQLPRPLPGPGPVLRPPGSPRPRTRPAPRLRLHLRPRDQPLVPAQQRVRARPGPGELWLVGAGSRDPVLTSDWLQVCGGKNNMFGVCADGLACSNCNRWHLHLIIPDLCHPTFIILRNFEPPWVSLQIYCQVCRLLLRLLLMFWRYQLLLVSEAEEISLIFVRNMDQTNGRTLASSFWKKLSNLTIKIENWNQVEKGQRFLYHIYI